MGWAACWAIFSKVHLVTLVNTPELHSLRVTFLSNIHIIHMYVFILFLYVSYISLFSYYCMYSYQIYMGIIHM
jgi:hypothetical protein